MKELKDVANKLVDMLNAIGVECYMDNEYHYRQAMKNHNHNLKIDKERFVDEESFCYILTKNHWIIVAVCENIVSDDSDDYEDEEHEIHNSLIIDARARYESEFDSTRCLYHSERIYRSQLDTYDFSPIVNELSNLKSE